MMIQAHSLSAMSAIAVLYVSLYFVCKDSFFTITIMIFAIYVPVVQFVCKLYRDKEEIVDAVCNDHQIRLQVLLKELIRAAIMFATNNCLDMDRARQLQKRWSEEFDADNFDLLKMHFDLMCNNQFLYSDEANELIARVYRLIKKIEGYGLVRLDRPHKYFAEMRVIEKEARKLRDRMC